MSRPARIALTVLALVLAIAVLTWVTKGSEIRRLLAVNALFEEENIVENFSQMPELFFHHEMSRGDGPVTPLLQAPSEVTAALPPLDAWVEERSLTSIVILHRGALVHEASFQGTAPTDRRISWSVAKSFLSALTGILLAEGAVDDVDDPVTKYAPELVGSAYDSASLRDVLQMSSGVKFDEDYLDASSDINRMGRALALGRSMNQFAIDLQEREREAGERWQYVSIDTHIIGMVLEGATGRSIASLMEEKIIQPMGLEANPIYVTDKGGTAFVLGGLNLTTRDYARFGQMFLDHGRYNGRQIVPSAWVSASTVPSAKTPAGEEQYGYQWWMPADAHEGEYYARGIYGQYVYIDTASEVVIASNAADRGFREPGSNDQNVAMFRSIAEALASVADEASADPDTVDTDTVDDAEAGASDAVDEPAADDAYDDAAE